MSMSSFIRTRSLPQLAGIAMIGAGATAFLYQATKNAVAAARYSEGWMKWVDAAGGVAVELFVASAAIGIISLAQRGKLTSKLSLGALMGLCVVFGVFAASQQITTGRAIHTADVQIASGAQTGRTTDLERARAELAQMANIPTVAAASAELMKLKSRKGWNETNGCANPASYAILCKQVATAVAAIGNAERKAQLETRVADLSKASATITGKQIATADPIATKLGQWLAIGTEDAQVGVAFFSAVTMMLLAMFGVHYGLLVYGMDHAETGATDKARTEVEVLKHPNFPGNVYVLRDSVQPPQSAPVIRDRSDELATGLLNAIRAA